MNALASAAFGIVSSVGACVMLASVASQFVADPEPHAFKDIAAHDLWTTKPVKVDPWQQHYERIPPLYSSYVTKASSVKLVPEDPAHSLRQLPTPKPKLSGEHLAWCAERYRSFNPITNSYRSYGGGMRECSSPFQQFADTADQHVGPKENAGAEAWCAARYKSYRPEDNSYQPWEGPRRTCDPPDTVLGPDRVATRD
ncbi:BA14K family protein [Rhizobium sp. BR 317]|uniref:BA14K family protein n=1 Tax=Rhizobium sp. BR 317 TaxID=3040015 RepID=UPI0039BFF472